MRPAGAAVTAASQAEAEDESHPLCSICLERPSNTSKIDSCAHVYCWACITLWGKINNLCPQCKSRFSIVTSIADPLALEFFEGPPSDSGEEEEEEEDEEEEGADGEQEQEEEEEEEDNELVGLEDEYVLDGFLVGDDDAIEYESAAGEGEEDEDEGEADSSSDVEPSSASASHLRLRRRRKERGGRVGKKKRRRKVTIQISPGEEEEDQDQDQEQEQKREEEEKEEQIKVCTGPPDFSRFRFTTSEP